jgi:branched-chain amino acid aminotransferase
LNKVWFDGRIVSADDFSLRPFTHALHYGSGVFEGVRAYETDSGSAVFRLQDHMRRFFASADCYRLQIEFTQAELESAVLQTLDANGMTSGYIRPLAFFGERNISLAPRYHCPTHVLVAVRPLSGSLVGGTGGVRVCMSRWQKTSSRSMPSTVKACGHYTNSILALHDAVAAGFDEAILLNDRGEVAEGTGENIFVVQGGRLRTNDASADILEGITRDTVMTLARDRGIPVGVGAITVGDLMQADEVFFTGTAAEVTPVEQIDARIFSTSRPVTEELRSAYAAAVRGNDRLHVAWLTRVEGAAQARGASPEGSCVFSSSLPTR